MSEWTELADGTSLLPEVPKALRRAAELAYENPGALDAPDEEDLFQRLNTSPGPRVQRDVREVLASAVSAGEKLRAIHKLLVEAGVQPATAPPDLKPVSMDEIRLVAWMAVQPSADADEKS